MTSFSTAESAASKAELFSLPADQMSHIQIYTVVQAPLERTLRLSGAVAYNGFLTTPVITQVGGPVSRIVVTPGEHVTRGPAAAVRRQPRLLAVAVGLHQGARRLPARGQVLQARAGPLRAPGHRAGRSRAGRIDPRAGGGRSAIQRTGHSHSGDLQPGKHPDRNRRRRKWRCWRRWREKWWSGSARRGNCCRPAERSASRFRT